MTQTEEHWLNEHQVTTVPYSGAGFPMNPNDNRWYLPCILCHYVATVAGYLSRHELSADSHESNPFTLVFLSSIFLTDLRQVYPRSVHENFS